MQKIEPTRLMALKVWWALTWRILVCNFLIAVVLGTVLQLLGANPRAVESFIFLMLIPTGVVIGVEVIYRMFRKKFRDFQIVLISPQES